MRKLSLALAVSLALTPVGIAALGVGDVKTHSALNEELAAEIDLLSVRPDELDVVSVELASPEAFARAGVERPYFLSRLRFQPEALADGRTVIRVTSPEPIREPFLNFLIEVNWPKGRIVREYTLLLDPPVTTARRPAPVRAPAVARAPADGAQRVTPRAQPSVALPVSESLEYGPTQKNDTLWSIARGMNIRGATVEQVVMALFSYNRDAFINDNVNYLKIGHVLRLPNRDAVFELDRAQARAVFQEHLDRWEPAVPRESPRAEARQAAEDAGAQAEEPEPLGGAQAVAGGVETEQARLELVSETKRDQEAPRGGEGLSETGIELLQKELLLAREETAIARQTSEDLRDQVEDLDAQLADMRRLVSLQNQQLAEMQVVAADVAEAPQPAEAPEGGDEVEAAVVEQPDGSAQPVVAQTEPGWLERISGSPALLAGAGGAALLLLTMFGFAVRRRRESEERPLAAAPAPLPETPAERDQGEAEWLPKGSQEDLAPGAGAATAEVAHREPSPAAPDVLSEAAVYAAYGRYDQAQNLLQQAMKAEPERMDIQFKLLSMYAASGKSSEFAGLAESMREAGADQQDAAAWEGVVAKGRELAPDHPLFAGAGAAPAKGEQSPARDAGIDLDLDQPFVQGEPAEPESKEAEMAAGFDFDLGELTPPETLEAEEAPQRIEEAEGDVPESVAEAPAAEELTREPAGGHALSLDDFAWTGPAGNEQEAEEQGLEAELEEFTLEGLSEAEGEEEGGVQTKLDLAQAYLDMGDPEDAKGILEEVLQEGTEVQRSQAEELLRKMGS